MNLVSLTAKRLMLIACSAICLGFAFPTSSFAQRKSLATCEKEWSANKAFNQAAGITERDWVAKCRADNAKKPADARRAEYARERSCAADWKAAKAAGAHLRPNAVRFYDFRAPLARAICHSERTAHMPPVGGQGWRAFGPSASGGKADIG